MSLREAKYESGDFQLGCALLPFHAITLNYVRMCTAYYHRLIMNIH